MKLILVSTSCKINLAATLQQANSELTVSMTLSVRAARTHKYQMNHLSYNNVDINKSWLPVFALCNCIRLCTQIISYDTIICFQTTIALTLRSR